MSTTTKIDFVAGISLFSLASGSPLSLSVLSAQDPAYSLSVKESIATEQQALLSAFEQLLRSLPQKLEQVVFTLPIYFTDPEKEEVYSAAKAAGWSVPRKFEDILDHVQTYHRSSVQENYTIQNELVLDIGPSASGSRLVSTEVEENIRMSDVINQSIDCETQSNVDEVLRKLVDPALATLQVTASAADSALKRIIIVHSSPTTTPPIVEQLRSRIYNPSLEFVLVPDPSQNAAALALAAQKWVLADKFIFNTAALRIGIAKSDGFVLTLIPYNFTLPNHRSVILTTSKDNQTKATIQIVAGVSPAMNDNTVVAELILNNLSSCSKGLTLIRVTLDVDQVGATKVFAEELSEHGKSGVRKTVELESITGDMTEDAIDAYRNGRGVWATLAEEAAEAENFWTASVAQGALPE